MTQWVNQFGPIITLLFTAAVGVSTVIYAVLTWRLVAETRRMRRAQTEPKIAVFYEPIEEFMNFGHLCVQNIGLGPAYEIQFAMESDGSKAGTEMLIKDFCKTKHLERGVRYLGPSQKLRSGFTSFPEGYEEKIKAILIVAVQYKSSDGRLHKDSYRLDFSELEGSERLGTPHLYSIAETLKKIQSDLHYVVTGVKRPKVDIFDADDRATARSEVEARLAEEKQRRASRDGGT